MTILGIPPKTTPAVRAMTDLIGARQTLVGKVEAINEADRRVALGLGREQDAIAAELPKAGFFRRAQLRRQVEAMKPKWAQALADRAVNETVIADLLKQIAALDEQLQAVNRHYSPRKPKPTTPPAEARN